ncbi:MAG: hypothetical protein D6737_05565 [Chloroflexi bacterium]|nr:MAG: hypothetical protein D6737_05565 [Chloroflexota bacterium]
MPKVVFSGRLWFALWIPLLAACNLIAEPTTAETRIEGAPVVTLLAPLPNASIREGVTINIQAAVTNAGADIDRVEVAVDGAIIDTLAAPNRDGTLAFGLSSAWQATTSGTHTIAVTAFRADGSSSEPAVANVNVLAGDGSSNSASAAAGDDAPNIPDENNNAQSDTTQPDTPQDDAPPSPVPPTPSRPLATFNVGVNVRAGPGTIYDAIGSFAPDVTSDVLAVNPGRTWYKVRYFNGEGWVFGELLTLSGDTSNLPVEIGPPVPTNPPPPTAIPPTDPPPATANLVILSVEINPLPLRCNEAAQINVTIQNDGSGPTPTDGAVFVEDVHVASGNPQQSTVGPVPVMQPGETFVAQMFLTVSTFFAEEHQIIITVDSNGQIPEVNEGDNQTTRTYILDRAGC